MIYYIYFYDLRFQIFLTQFLANDQRDNCLFPFQPIKNIFLENIF